MGDVGHKPELKRQAVVFSLAVGLMLAWMWPSVVVIQNYMQPLEASDVECVLPEGRLGAQLAALSWLLVDCPMSWLKTQPTTLNFLKFVPVAAIQIAVFGLLLPPKVPVGYPLLGPDRRTSGLADRRSHKSGDRRSDRTTDRRDSGIADRRTQIADGQKVTSGADLNYYLGFIGTLMGICIAMSNAELAQSALRSPSDDLVQDQPYVVTVVTQTGIAILSTVLGLILRLWAHSVQEERLGKRVALWRAQQKANTGTSPEDLFKNINGSDADTVADSNLPSGRP